VTDLIANPDCILCHGTGTIRERRPDYWGLPAYEYVLCDCIDDEKDDDHAATIECAGCGWIGTAEDLIAPWSDWEPSCPSCLNNNFEDVEE